MFAISMFMFLKKDILNFLNISLLMSMLIFPVQTVDFKFFMILYIVLIVVPKDRMEINEIILRYFTTVFLMIQLVTNARTNFSFDINQFIVANLLVVTLIPGLSKKLLSIVLLCFPVLTIALDDLTMSLIFIPFIMLPLLHEKLKTRDFSIYCLACIVIIGRFGVDQVNISLIAFIILSLFICMGDKMRIKEKVVL
jgi:hypothetical protein